MNNCKVKVLYIIGSQRSGSTLLDCLFGQVPGFFSTGELRYLWHRGWIEDQLCGCGHPFRCCTFWRAVIEKLKVRLEGAVDIHEIDSLSQLTQHYRYAPLSFLPLSLSLKTDIGRMTDRFARILAPLYQEIQSVSEARVVIDSSKSFMYALILSSIPEIELHILHLFRDSRAVAFSNQRIRSRPEVYQRDAYMGRLSLLGSSISWNTVHALAPSLKLKNISSFHLIHYEELIRRPEEVLKGALLNMGEDPGRETFDFIEDQQAYLKPNHTVAGNPMRFRQGTIALQMDDEWRHQMPPSQKNLVTFLTLPLLAAYRLTGARPRA